MSRFVTQIWILLIPRVTMSRWPGRAWDALSRVEELESSRPAIEDVEAIAVMTGIR